MIEREMQELLWMYPERLLNEPLKQLHWEERSPIGRADLVFEDRHGGILVVEVKHGKLPREAAHQLMDYSGMMKQKYPNKSVELMAVANVIPSERRLACETKDIDCREISERTFRKVAADFGYAFKSESNEGATGDAAEMAPPPSAAPKTAWLYQRGKPSTNEQDFLARCDEAGKAFFSKLFSAQKRSTTTTKITWDHESGFSIQFYFQKVGFAPLVWGFPGKNRDGKAIRQRLDFPFDFALRKGVPQTFVDEFAGSLSSVVYLSGGTKRPSISIETIDKADNDRIVEMIFGLAVEASEKKAEKLPK